MATDINKFSDYLQFNFLFKNTILLYHYRSQNRSYEYKDD